MTQITLTPAQLAALEYSLDDSRIRNYSGRFMYGAECLAIVTENPIETIAQLIHGLMGDGDDIFAEVANLLAFEDVRSDSLGYSTVVYWPQIALPDGFEEVEDS
jgi:hypothetical protein